MEQRSLLKELINLIKKGRFQSPANAWPPPQSCSINYQLDFLKVARFSLLNGPGPNDRTSHLSSNDHISRSLSSTCKQV